MSTAFLRPTGIKRKSALSASACARRPRFLQRKCACGGTAGPSGEFEECRKNRLSIQRKTRNPGLGTQNEAPIPASVHDVLRSPGEPLDPATRAFMEPRLGHDFGNVRIHTDARAAESARGVNALAYTVGRDVVFGAGQYDPGTETGKKLLGHELAHVVQQRNQPATLQGQLQVNEPGEPLEKEAEDAAGAIVARHSPLRAALATAAPPPRPLLQRTAKFVEDGSAIDDFNLAERVLSGEQAGDTQFVLNSSTFTNLQEGRSALHAPDIGSAPRGANAVDCWFDSVPDNEVSFAMRVLKPGPWTAATTKGRMVELFGALPACQKAGDGAATLIVKGMPNDEEQRKRTRTHEDQHVKDYKSILKDILVPWDKRVADAESKKQKLPGSYQSDCERKLYRAFVGQKSTPDEIVTELIDSINKKAKDFHDTAAGRKVNISNPVPGRNCNTVTAEAR